MVIDLSAEQGRLLMRLERGTGIEPATSSLGSWHSTAELPPLDARPNLTLFAGPCKRTHSAHEATWRRRELEEYCRRRTWSVAQEYVDTGISGSCEKRPEPAAHFDPLRGLTRARSGSTFTNNRRHLYRSGQATTSGFTSTFCLLSFESKHSVVSHLNVCNSDFPGPLSPQSQF